MIMVRRNAYGVDQFRYSVIKNFSQDSNGVVTGTLSLDPKDDPLEYLGLNSEFENNLKWRTDREWLQLTKNSSWPTAIFSIPQTVTLAPNLNAEQEAVSQLPDFVLYPHRGYAFQSGKQHESDHGGLYPEEVKHSFFISGIGERKMNKRVVVPKAVLSRDFTPTVLDFAGFGVSEVQTQGESHRPHIELMQNSGN
jgi:arylsulfatase A-like enzyme